MLGFSNKKPTQNDLIDSVQKATDYADLYHYTEPEQTTYRLRHALNDLKDLPDLASANLYSELMHRGTMLTSDLRRRELDHSNYGRWLTAHSKGLGEAKIALKGNLRNPWKDNYDWLGQSLAHSSIMQNRHARMAYEQLAITYRLQQHLMNLEQGEVSNPKMMTTQNGYKIEQVMPTSARIQQKADRLIKYYYSPIIIG